MSIHVDRELDTAEIGTEELDTDASNMDWGFAISFPPSIAHIYVDPPMDKKSLLVALDYWCDG